MSTASRASILLLSALFSAPLFAESIAGSLYEAIQGESWDDLRVPVTSIPLQGQSGDPDIDTTGILLFDDTTAEQVSVLYQMPHAWKFGTSVVLHLHWSKSTDAVGDIEWEEKHRTCANNSVCGSWTDWAPATTRSQAIASNQAVLIDGWAATSMTGLIGSDMLHVQFRRNPGATDDNYGADARLFDADLHYRVHGIGSDQEYPRR